MSKNDSKIIELKEGIAKKKKALAGGHVKVTTKTNCSLQINGTRYNINTLKGQELQRVLIAVNVLFLSAKDLEIQDEYKHDGYILQDWLSDLKSRVKVEQYKKKVKEMGALEKQLDSLLSDDKLTELTLVGISDLIGNL